MTKLQYHPTAIEVEACRMLGEEYTAHVEELRQQLMKCSDLDRVRINAIFKEMRAFHKAAVRQARDRK